MTDDIDRDEERALTAEYVLGLLAPEEANAYEALLVVDPGLRGEYAFVAERMAAMTDDIAPVQPPKGMLNRIEAALFGQPEPATSGGWWARLGLLPAMLSGLAAALVVLWLIDALPGVGGSGGSPVAEPTLRAQIAAEDQSLVVAASYDAESGILRLEQTGGGTAPEGRARELWLIAGEDAPQSLGLLAASGPTELQIPPEQRARLSGAVLAISDEPEGGSPTGAPTGAVLAAGEVVAL